MAKYLGDESRTELLFQSDESVNVRLAFRLSNSPLFSHTNIIQSEALNPTELEDPLPLLNNHWLAHPTRSMHGSMTAQTLRGSVCLPLLLRGFDKLTVAKSRPTRVSYFSPSFAIF